MFSPRKNKTCTERVYNRSHAKDSVCPQKVDVALIQSMCQSGRCCYLAHIEIRMTWTYATEVTVIEEITISYRHTLRWFGQYVDESLFVSNDKVRSTR